MMMIMKMVFIKYTNIIANAIFEVYMKNYIKTIDT